MKTLPELRTGQVFLVIAPGAGWEEMMEMAARLACRAPLRVLDGGNQFNAYPLARAIRRFTGDLPGALERIALARVFTCYQMETLLLTAAPQPIPTLVLDFLATFHDENVPFADRRGLLARCTAHLVRLSRAAPVLVSARPASLDDPQRATLLADLAAVADQVSQWQPPAQPLPPPRLF